MTLNFEAVSHIGNKRKVNEDRYFARRQSDGSLLLAVADGMGGVPGGDKASSLAVGAFADVKADTPMDQDALRQVLIKAHTAVSEYAAKHPEMDGMGTTLTTAVIQRETVFWAHVGDSRLYILQGSELKQLSEDHRFLSSLVKNGDISAEEAKVHPLRNMLDQCLGCSSIKPDLGRFRFDPHDTLMLCSDGLYEDVPPEAIAFILGENASLESRARRLVEVALSNAGSDNITLILAELHS